MSNFRDKRIFSVKRNFITLSDNVSEIDCVFNRIDQRTNKPERTQLTPGRK